MMEPTTFEVTLCDENEIIIDDHRIVADDVWHCIDRLREEFELPENVASVSVMRAES